MGVGGPRVASDTGRRRGRRDASGKWRRRSFPSPLRSLNRVRVRSVGGGTASANFGTRAVGSPTPFYMRSATGGHQPQNGWAPPIRARDKARSGLGERSIQQVHLFQCMLHRHASSIDGSLLLPSDLLIPTGGEAMVEIDKPTKGLKSLS